MLRIAALTLLPTLLLLPADTADAADEGLAAVVRLLATTDDDAVRVDLLSGTLKGLEGRRRVAMPKAWPAAYRRLRESASPDVQRAAVRLALVFDDPVAFDSLRKQALDRKAAPQQRREAIVALVAKQDRELPPLLLKLIDEEATQSAALRGLAEFDDPRTVAAILAVYKSLGAPRRQDALQTLASRRKWAAKLLDSVESGRIPREDLSAFTARQLRNLGDARITERVRNLWGKVRATPADKARKIASLKKRLTPESLARADRSAGRVVFQKTCANCHKLFGEGGAIGPDITGSQRRNLDYILENLVDPSATVSKDFQMQLFQTTAGRVITGLVVADNKAAVTVQTVNDKIVIPNDEIESHKASNVSMMPEGMLEKLSQNEIRDLIAYLAGSSQVALKEHP